MKTQVIPRSASNVCRLNVVEKLPQDVGERLLDLAAGKLVTPPAPVSMNASPVENEDASRDLIVVKSRDELRIILDAPMAGAKRATRREACCTVRIPAYRALIHGRRARDAVFVTWAGEPSRFLIRAARKGWRAK